MRRLLVVTPGFPSARRPYEGTFVGQIVSAIAALGLECSVIRPVSVHRHGEYAPVEERAVGSGRVRVFSPPYLSLSHRDLKVWHTARGTQALFERAVWRTCRHHQLAPDAVYGHFVYAGGVAAVRVGARLGVPAFVGGGESQYDNVEPFGFPQTTRVLARAAGVIAVSGVIQRNFRELFRIPDEKIIVLPNGVDHRHFYPRDRAAMRAKHGLPMDRFIVAFVGRLTTLKGAPVLAQAVRGLENVDVLYIGDGGDLGQEPHALHRGKLAHALIPEYLSAADVFVLPTLSEGCCNAILEAMSCRLPVISSDGEFNDDILTDAMALRVNPLDADAVRAAIVALRDDPVRREAMAQAAHRWSQRFDVTRRAEAMVAWMRAQGAGRAACAAGR